MNWDVTDAVSAWLMSDVPNYGIVLKRDYEAPGTGGVEFANRFSPDPAIAPKLVVTYAPPGEYTYDQAREAGALVPPLPSELGLPACSMLDPNWPGFSSAEEEAATDDTTDSNCAVDPRTSIYFSGPAVPRPSSPTTFGYHFAGIESSRSLSAPRYQGVWASLEVGNPSVEQRPLRPDGFPNCGEFMGARVIAERPGEGTFPWTEIGWIEMSCRGDTQALYTYSGGGMYQFWQVVDGFPVSLQSGRYYRFRVRDCPGGTCQDIYWQGAWRTVTANSRRHCRSDTATRNCQVNVKLETVSTGDSTPHPDENAPVDGPGINVKRNSVRTAPETWMPWTAANVPTVLDQDEPYDVCPFQAWVGFWAGKNLVCP
jgi:hypothetical protein